MFKNILIGTALTLVAASTSLSPALAKSVPHNYADPCKTALENFKQANWEKTHRTDQGNLGGAEGWDELADAADQNAKTQRSRAAEHQETAKTSSDPAFWNQQAADANREAEEWDNRAMEHRVQADKMRGEAKDYEEAAKKALAECWKLLNVGTVRALPGYRDITINGKPLMETTETAEPAKTERKPGKKPIRKAQKEDKKKPKPVKVKKPASESQTAAQSIARDVAVSVATQLIFGETSGMGHKNNKKHHKLDRHQMMEGQAMGEGKSRHKMKRNKLMDAGLSMF